MGLMVAFSKNNSHIFFFCWGGVRGGEGIYAEAQLCLSTMCVCVCVCEGRSSLFVYFSFDVKWRGQFRSTERHGIFVLFFLFLFTCHHSCFDIITGTDLA